MVDVCVEMGIIALDRTVFNALVVRFGMASFVKPQNLILPLHYLLVVMGIVKAYNSWPLDLIDF